METPYDQFNNHLLSPQWECWQELPTLQDLEVIARRSIMDEVERYFYFQEQDFVQRVYHWIVDAPRDEWMLRLVYIKYRDSRFGAWSFDWMDMYDQLKQGTERSVQEVAKAITDAAEETRNNPYYSSQAASNEPRKADRTVASHTNIFRKIVDFLFDL